MNLVVDFKIYLSVLFEEEKEMRALPPAGVFMEPPEGHMGTGRAILIRLREYQECLRNADARGRGILRYGTSLHLHKEGRRGRCAGALKGALKPPGKMQGDGGHKLNFP